MVSLAVNSSPSDNKYLFITKGEEEQGLLGSGAARRLQMGVIYSSLSHCWLKHSRTKFILGLTAQERPSCLITLIIMLSFIIFFCCSPLPTAKCKHPNPSTHKSRQLLHCWTVSKRHIFKDSISVPLSTFQNLCNSQTGLNSL